MLPSSFLLFSMFLQFSSSISLWRGKVVFIFPFVHFSIPCQLLINLNLIVHKYMYKANKWGKDIIFDSIGWKWYNIKYHEI